MTSLYRYILATDSGMAPCIDNGLVTLATCKPKIRAYARKGDWIAGFAPISSIPERNSPPGRLVYLAKVERIVPAGDYEKEFPGRSDAIYQELVVDENTASDLSNHVKVGLHFFRRKRLDYHPEEKNYQKDLSADVLVFDQSNSWYFGGKPILLPDEFFSCVAIGRGYRKSGVNDADINRLVSWIKDIYPPGVYGRPREELRKLIKLAAFRPLFEDDPNAFGSWANAKSNFPYFAYSHQARQFLNLVGKEWTITNFDWSRWAETREGQNLLDKNCDFRNADFLQIKKVLTSITRKERFCEGTLQEMCQYGFLSRIVTRAEELASI